MKEENWEKEFDERYYDINTPSGLKQGKFLNFIIMVKDIKSFIRNLLEEEKKKLAEEKAIFISTPKGKNWFWERWLEEILPKEKEEFELTESIRKHNKENGYPEDYSPLNENHQGWNACLEEIKQRIKNN